MKDTYVIGCRSAGFSKNQIIYFRKKFTARSGADFNLEIFAEAQYKLYINGIFVGVGPAKRNDREIYHDKLEAGKYLKDGENEIFVSVLNLANECDLPSHRYATSLIRSGKGVLEIEGKLDGKPFITDKTWECAVEGGVEFFVPEYAYYTGMPERVSADKYHRVEWEAAEEVVPPERQLFCGEISRWYSKDSGLPMQRLKKKEINLLPDAVFDYGCMTIAYLDIGLSGKGRVKLTYAECKKKEGSEDRAAKDGKALGDYDIIEVDGDMAFVPYRFRCFRFIGVETEGNVKITRATLYETGYPVKISDNYDFGNETDNKLWEISARTLRLCMTDTYNDCPYYEQLQYTMDTYMQCLFSYRITGDDRLWRRAIRDFALSQDADGLTQCRVPSAHKQYIPSFSLFYVMMVLSHYDFCGDFSVIDENMPFIMRVISWYRKHCDENGLVKRSIHWHFIDWAEDFKTEDYTAERGMPFTEPDASLAVESLMLCYVLRRAQKTLAGTVYSSIAEDYGRAADKIAQGAEKYYYCGDNGLYANSEYKRHFCQHTQLWAVLSECATGDKARRAIENSFKLEGRTVSFAYAYILFRALEKAGLYSMRKPMLDMLRGLIALNCTTIPETPTDTRSECHAWGAVAVYEFTTMDLGVKNIGGKIVISPYTAERESACGTVYVSGRAVYVSWKKKDGRLYIYTDAPDAEIVTSEDAVICTDKQMIGECK